MKQIDSRLLSGRPAATAVIQGSRLYPTLRGQVQFFPAPGGTLVVAELWNLPGDGFFAMHLHSGNQCDGNSPKPFSSAGEHWSIGSQVHPYHTGDLPVLLSNHGYAWNAVFTERFRPQQAKGHTLIIHSMPDDFRTQPAGNAGDRIGCGVVR